jgi:ATP synthase I chain.
MSVRALTLQVFWLVAGGVIVLLWKGDWTAIAAVYGGAVVPVLTAMSIWQYRRACRRAPADAGRTLAYAVGGEVQRFAMLAVWLVLGFGRLGLDPVGVIAGFVALQIAAVVMQGLGKS